MKSTQCNTSRGLRFPKEDKLQYIREVINHELTELQRQTLTAYYFYHFTIPEIARMRCVQKSTVSRTLRRAENRIRKYLQY